MYSTVLVPLDRSEAGEFAVGVGAAIAKRLNVPLRLLHVLAPSVPPVAEFGGAGVNPVDPKTEADAAGYLERLAAREREAHRITVDFELLRGQAEAAITDSARRHAPALIVMTSRGRGGLQRAVLGSVTDALVRRSPAPVLVVRTSRSAARLAEERLERVLLPLDGSERDEDIFDHAQTIGRAMQAEFMLLQVISPRQDPSRPAVRRIDPKELKAEKTAAQTYLQHVADHLGRSNLAASIHVVIEDDPAAAILEFAKNQKVDLIAMATRARGGLERLREGSVADRVVRKTEAPVLLLRAAGTA